MTIWRVLVVITLLAAAIGAPRAQGGPTYLTDPALLGRALAALRAEVGANPQVMSLKVEPRRITLQVRGPQRAASMEEWTVSLLDLWITRRDRVGGPRAASAPNHVRDVASGYFRLGEVNLDALPRLLEEAVGRAALDTPGRVTAAVIERGWHLFPEPAWADLRWVVTVVARDESARIMADPNGRITRADLSQTNRARNLDMLAHDDSDAMLEAQRALLNTVGRGRSVRDISIRADTITVTIRDADAAGVTDIRWTPSGVFRVAMPAFAEFANTLRSENKLAPFSLTEIDFATLPRVKEAARDLVRRPAASVTEIEVRKLDFAGELRWIVTFDGGSSREIVAELNMAVEIRDVHGRNGAFPRL